MIRRDCIYFAAVTVGIGLVTLVYDAIFGSHASVETIFTVSAMMTVLNAINREKSA